MIWTKVSDFDRMFRAMNQLHSRINEVFTGMNTAYEYQEGLPITECEPFINLYDSGNQLEVKAEVPGLSKEDMSIKVQGNYLEIRGGRHLDEPEGYTKHRLERKTDEFCRSFTLPCDINQDNIQASLKDGILSLIMPKIEAEKVKKIQIS